MNKIEDPWKGLSPGNINAKRVNQSGRYDFFWIVSEHEEPGLVLRLPTDIEEVKPLPKMRNIDLAYRDVGGGRVLAVLLRDTEQRELFSALCHDIVGAGEEASGIQDALQRSVRRTLRWHHLLRGGRSDLLTLEEQRGLLGELQFLGRLIELLNPRAAIEGWKGPTGSSKDFELDGCLVEVKARRGAAKPFVQISSEDQLADVDGCRLFLVVSSVDAAVKPNGLTLTDHVLALDKLFAATDAEAYQLWEEAILASGFAFEDDYSDRRWTIGKSVQFEVGPGFPRIAVPVPAGVSGVRYSIGLDACSPFAVDAGDLDHMVRGSNG